MATQRLVAGLRARHSAALIGLCAATALGFAMLYVVCSALIYEVDLGVYRDGAFAAWTHPDLYSLRFAPSGLPFTYPPAAALLLTPFSWLPVVPGQLLWTLGCIGAVVSFAVVCVRRYLVPGPAAARIAFALTIALAVGCDPTRVGTLAGQINAVLALAVVLDLNRITGRLPHGCLIGLAAGIKLIPLFLVAYLLATRRYRAAFSAIVTFGIVTAIGMIALPHISSSYWNGYFWDSQRIGGIEYISNQSMHGFLIRTLGSYGSATVPWLVSAIALTVAAMWVCRRVWPTLPRVADAIAIGAMLLVSPVSWSPHWILALPVLLAAVRLGWQTRSVVLLTITALTTVCLSIGFIWFVPHNHGVEYRHAWWQIVFGNSYVLLGLALAVALSLSALRFVGVFPGPGELVLQVRNRQHPVPPTIQLRSTVTKRFKSSSVL